jgi:transcriptional regulator
MYVPEPFAVDDRATLLAFVAAHPFATVLTADGGMCASHLPLLCDGNRGKLGILRGHLARDNEQFAQLAAGAEALAIFHGPHAYVSPSAYVETAAVPTWNYVAVHARGRARLTGERELRQLLDEMIARFDHTGWRLEMSAEKLQALVDRVAGFELEIERLEGKWKLSQNRSREDQERVAEWLARGDDESRAVARVMRARLT